MNYRHGFHAGNFADVLKHALLVRLIRAYQRKEKGFLFVDTHAGRGSYALAQGSRGDSYERAPEWPAGIGRLWAANDLPAELADYVGLVRAFDGTGSASSAGPTHYPGSPSLARLLLRPQDRMELWERHPEEYEHLRALFEGARRTGVHEADGYGAPTACLPPPERRALVLIDPPYEEASEIDRVCGALSLGLQRMRQATFALWYPLSPRVEAAVLANALRQEGLPALLCEWTAAPDAARMSGCALAVVNPPWKFEAEARSVSSYLGSCGRGDGRALSSVRWIVSG